MDSIRYRFYHFTNDRVMGNSPRLEEIMKKRKPFYNVGDLLQTRNMWCQTEYDYKNKLCLVVKVFQKKGKSMYEVKIVNYEHFPCPHIGVFYDPPFETVNDDRSHIILGQHKLRKEK